MSNLSQEIGFNHKTLIQIHYWLLKINNQIKKHNLGLNKNRYKTIFIKDQNNNILASYSDCFSPGASNTYNCFFNLNSSISGIYVSKENNGGCYGGAAAGFNISVDELLILLFNP